MEPRAKGSWPKLAVEDGGEVGEEAAAEGLGAPSDGEAGRGTERGLQGPHESQCSSPAYVQRHQQLSNSWTDVALRRRRNALRQAASQVPASTTTHLTR